MKKVMILLTCVLTIGAATAQEKKGGFALDLGLGTSQFGNYSPLSVFADPTDTYALIPAEHLSLGYHDGNGWFYGLTLGLRSGNTAFQDKNENFMDISMLLDIRDYFKLTDKLELEVGITGGLLVHNNFFDFMGEHFSPTQLGYEGYLQVGLNYLFKEGHYFGIRAMYPHVGALGNSFPSLPDGVMNNQKKVFTGYSIQLNYGIRF